MGGKNPPPRISSNVTKNRVKKKIKIPHAYTVFIGLYFTINKGNTNGQMQNLITYILPIISGIRLTIRIHINMRKNNRFVKKTVVLSFFRT